MSIESVEFFKFHGCGNDFVFIDNREICVSKEKMGIWAQHICRRSFGVGADGIAFIESSTYPEADYIWHFYNADGSRAEMCGNAARCVGLLAVELSLAGHTHVLGTDAGLIHIVVAENMQRTTVTMTDPHRIYLDIELTVEGNPICIHSVNIGVPHVVVFVENLQNYNVMSQGNVLRHHEYFFPEGVNVNFATVVDSTHIEIRTYERGVEAETLACGTGVCATAVIAHQLGMTEECVYVTTASKDILRVILKNGKVLMEGPAVKTFTGKFYISSLGL